MIKSKFKPPYKKNGRTNFPQIQGKSGVYLIKKNNKIVYIGHSTSDLYKTMYRHFQSWTDKTQQRVTYKNLLDSPRTKLKVRVILTTKKQAPRLEKYLILKIKPEDNPNKYEMFKFSPIEKKQIEKAGNDFGKIEKAPF